LIGLPDCCAVCISINYEFVRPYCENVTVYRQCFSELPDVEPNGWCPEFKRSEKYPVATGKVNPD
jgi:hypothetical protein